MRQHTEAIEGILRPFIDEALPDGGIDVEKSRWQKPGRGSGPEPDKPDLRYMRALAEALYRADALTNNATYREVANAQARFTAQFVRDTLQTWLMGVAMETVGFFHRFNEADSELIEAVQRIVGWARRRRREVTTVDGVTYRHFPCGYACLKEADDAGWTNDLSIFGSGLVWAYEVTGDRSILEDAVSYAEYFVQPWRSGSLGDDGLWHAGTWHEDLGTWVIGPLHYGGFESTDAYGDEASWVFSTFSCIDYLTRLYRHEPDPSFLDRCLKAAEWTFRECQFDDGAVGICGRDDKWLGTTGYAISQVAAIERAAGGRAELQPLREAASRSYDYLRGRLPDASLDDHGVGWVNRTTLADPMVNVGWLWLAAVIGLLDGEQIAG